MELHKTFIVIATLLVGCQHSKDKNIDALIKKNDSLSTQIQKLNNKVNDEISKSQTNQNQRNTNVKYCFVRFLYLSNDNSTDINCGVSKIEAINNLDNEIKYKFMDDKLEQFKKDNLFSSLILRNRKFFCYDTYAEASEARNNNNGVTYDEVIEEHRLNKVGN